MSGGIEAVTFDFWNTLAYEEPGHLRGRRITAWMGLLEEAEARVEPDRLSEAFDASWEAYVAAWKANRQYQASHAVDDILGRLGLDPPADLRDGLEDAFRRAPEGAELRLTGGIEGCLRTLKDAGLRLGIVCDVGMAPSPFLRKLLEDHGLLVLFDHWSFSDEVGVYKPDPEIFRHALAGLGDVPAERAAHVGDMRRTDVAGALAMGMTAVRYTGVFDDRTQARPEADLVVASHADLPGALGVV